MASTGRIWQREEVAGAGDVLGAVAAGEQAIVADAMEACGEHVDEKAAICGRSSRNRTSTISTTGTTPRSRRRSAATATRKSRSLSLV